MFGYVHPSMDKLSDEDKKRFSAVYCGLCHTLGNRYGTRARFILNYDFAFLALLLSETEDPIEHKRCIAHPLSGRDAYPENPALTLAADCSVILAWWQIQDAIQDSGKSAEKAKYRTAASLLRMSYEKARQNRPDFDQSAFLHLQHLNELEENHCSSLDEPADAFGLILKDAAGELRNPVKSRVLGEFLYQLGRWIYLVDAADDLEEDFQSGGYNPLIYRFRLNEGKLDEDAKKILIFSLDNSVRRMEAAFELWDFGVWSPIIRAVVYEGLFLVGRAVLEGTFQAELGFKPTLARNKETV